MSALSLPERLTMSEARATLAQLQPGLAGSGEVVVDCSALKSLDSAAVAVLLECRRQALAQGRGFVLKSPPSKLADLARLYGVNGLLGA